MKSLEENFASEKDALLSSMAHIQQKQEELQALLDEENQKHLQVIEESKAMEAQLHRQKQSYEGPGRNIKSQNTRDLSTQSYGSLQKIYAGGRKGKPKDHYSLHCLGGHRARNLQATTSVNYTQLVGGNLIVAMLYYGVNITNLDAQSFQMLLRNGNRTTKEFLVFMTLSQKIALNDWSLLLKQPIFLMVANLRVWCTLLDYSSDYEEDEEDILDMEPVPEELPYFTTHQEQYKKNWKIMANIRKEIIVI